MIFLGFAQGSSASTSGSRVVLPAPGGATSTAALRARSTAVNSGSAASIGSGGSRSIVTGLDNLTASEGLTNDFAVVARGEPRTRRALLRPLPLRERAHGPCYRLSRVRGPGDDVTPHPTNFAESHRCPLPQGQRAH